MKGKLSGNKHPFYGTYRSKETVERMRNGKKDKTIYIFKNLKPMKFLQELNMILLKSLIFIKVMYIV